jgi:transposase
MEYIAFDAHKRYTLASVVRPDGRLVREQRIAHERGALREFLERCDRGSPVAVETIGNWYWIVDEIEAAGCVPQLVHARKAKLMMGEINKTDRLDARGLNRLQQAGTLPTVWIPPGEFRDQRDLPRTRMVLVRQRTRLKNRIHATLAKSALHDVEVSDHAPAAAHGVRDPGSCWSRSRGWTARCGDSSNGSRRCSSRRRRFSSC